MNERQRNIRELCDDMHNDQGVLEALGEILTSLDEDTFPYCQSGLRKILQLYVEQQEQRFADIELQNANSPEKYLRWANDAAATVIHHRMGKHSALEQVERRLKGLFAAISEYGLPNEGEDAFFALRNLIGLKETLRKMSADMWNKHFLCNDDMRQKAVDCLNRGGVLRIERSKTEAETQEANSPEAREVCGSELCLAAGEGT